VLRFEAEGFAAFAQRFQARDALQGRMVTLSDGSHGRADGVDATGALRVQTDAGCRVVSSAEVSVRPC
jgi:BirA family biotin operon repressor/biotin-[acetyl-CoA-carboxylase] ligase